MTLIDIAIIVIFLVGITIFGSMFAKRAGQNTDNYVLAGRKLPWWLAGVSASAASFNADSPQHQSRKVRETGLQGAWFYWFNAIASILNVVFIARLFRRARIQTVPEFYDIRYGGSGKHVARVWGAISISLIQGTAFVAGGMLGLSKVIQVLFQLPDEAVWWGVTVSPAPCIAVGLVALALVYATTSGVIGVVWTDLIEFSVAMLCSYMLLFFVYREVGWAEGLNAGIENLNADGSFLDFEPTLSLLFVFWMVLLPLSNFGGHATDMARYMSVKNEREVFLTGLCRLTTHFVLRGWPWYLCGLISLLLITDAQLIDEFGPLESGKADAEMAYPSLILHYLPIGFTGLMIAGFLSAFMSSIDTLTHNAAAVFVNDIYRPYVVKNRDDRHYVKAMRVGIVLSAVLGTIVAFQVDEIFDIIVFLLLFDAGAGVLLAARWFWWRVNAWADVAAHLSGLPIALLFLRPEWIFGEGADFATPIAAAIGLGTSWDAVFVTKLLVARLAGVMIWLPLVLFLPSASPDVLDQFYRRVRPFGWWGPVARRNPEVSSPDRFGRDVALVLVTVGLYFSLLFAVGALLLAKWNLLAITAVVAAAGYYGFIRLVPPNRADEDEPLPE
jgi:solute:Na+ symporter, SSS family